MKGKITLSRYSSNQENLTPVHLQVEDDESSTTFLNLEMSLENFGLMLTGLGYIDCDFELTAKNVGKTREHKTEKVTVRDAWNVSDEDKLEALKPFEVDGWIGSKYDLGNTHKMVKDASNVYEVGFTRYVD